MYFVLGVLTAGLLALLVMPAIWRRTARLTRQRIETSLPMSMAEIQADRDQLRAEFAITTRQLEMTVDRLRDKTTEQVIEVNEKRAEIVRLTNDVNDKAKTIEGLEERAARLVADLAAADDRLNKINERVRQREATLVERDAEIADLQARLNTAQQLTDEQKLELAVRDTEIANLTNRLADAQATEKELIAARDKLSEELAAERTALAGERRRIANLEASLARLEAERIDRLGELERRAAEARELVAELAKSRTSAEDLAARVAELQAARAPDSADRHPLTAQQETAGARNDTPREDDRALADGDNVAKAIAAAEAENATLSERLATLEAEHASLQAQNERLRRVTSADWDVEAENTLLRERLAGVAAEVLHLTMPSSGDTVARATENGVVNGGNGSGNGEKARHDPETRTAEATEGATPPEGKSLAERLRALQHTAARH